LRGTWRPLSFLETSFLVGMDRVRQSDRQLQARGEGPNIAGLRLGRVLAGRANSGHYSIELGARAAFHLSPARATRPAGGLLRLRAAYGVAGRRPLLSAALAAERTRELEGGADAALWDGRLQLGVTLYDRRTSGVVVPSASAPSGLGIANLGRLSNRGIEIALTAEILRGEARSWAAWRP